MVHYNVSFSRVWREAMGPGFVSGPGEKTIAVIAAASVGPSGAGRPGRRR